MTSAATDEGPARQLALDGIRGLAILLVLVYHFALLSGTDATWLDDAFAKVTAVGWAGVDLFFVLSGFLITRILYDSKAAVTGYFRNFYARRTLRIFPVYYLTLFLLAVVLPLVLASERDAAEAVRGHLVWYATYVTNLRFDSNPVAQADFPLTSHLWSLAAEEQFYVVWPAVVLLLSRKRLMALCGIVTIVSLALRSGLDLAGVDRQVAHDIMPAHMDALGIGALIALASREPADLRALARWAWPAAGAGGAVVLALFFSRDRFSPYDGGVQTIGYTALAVLFGALVLLAITSPPASRMHYLWTRPVLRWLGKYSYALYLFHWPAATLLAKHTDIVGSVPDLWGSGLPGELLFVAAAAALSMTLAWLSWHLWEQPFLRLKKRFPYRSPPVPQRLPA